MIQDLHLYVDSQARQFVKGPQNNAAFKFPPIYQGDTLNLFLHGVAPNTDPTSLNVYEEAPIAFSGIKVGIGLAADAAPSGGTFKIRLVGHTEATVALPHDADQATVLAALNALPSVQAVSAQGIRLDLPPPVAPNVFLIRWVNPAITALFEFTELYCEPLCFQRSSVQTLAYGQIQVLKYIVAPYCFTDQFSYPSPTAATTASIRQGTGTQNCVQSLTVPHDAMGSFSLTFASNTTSLVTVADVQGLTDGSNEIAGALNGLYSDGQTRFGVTQDAPGVYYIEMVGPLAKLSFPVIEVDMHGQEPLDTPKGSVPLNGVDLELALHGQKQISLLFELEITNGSNVVTIQTNVTVINDMIDGAMALVATPPWQTPGSPTYVPPDGQGQPVIVAPGAYITPVGSGTAVGASGQDFVITHNLGTSNVLVGVRETGGTHLRIPDNQYTCTILNDNQVEVVFAAAPTQDQYYVVIAAVIPATMGLPHHTHPIADIIDLQDLINSLLAGQNPLELWPNIPDSKLPKFIAWTNADGTYRFARLPTDLLPDGAPYIGADGGLYVNLPGPPPITVQLLDPTGHIPVSALPLDPSTWPGLEAAIIKVLQNGQAPLPPGYIPIVINEIKGLTLPSMATLRQGTTPVIPSLPRALPGFSNGGTVSGALPLLPDATLAGTVSTVNTGANDGASATAVRNRAPQFFRQGVKIGCDGNQFYEVCTDGITAYPQEMERDLFTLHVAPNMLAANCRFAANAQVTIGLTGPAAETVRASYVLQVQFGHVNGPLLSSVTWDSDAILQTLVVADAAVTHAFGVSVQRSADGNTRTATASFYGRSVGIPAPGNDFVVRARLTRFDLEDVPFAQGQIALSLKGTASVVSLANT